jgi:hypothetical protein
MPSLLRKLAVVSVIGLLLFVLAAAWRSRSSARYASAKDRATRDCKEWRSLPEHANADVCRVPDDFAGSIAESWKRAGAEIADAKMQLALGDRAGGEAAIGSALARAVWLERRGPSVGVIMAADIVRRSLDLLVDAPASTRRALLAGVALEPAAAPFERERIHHQWTLAHWNEHSPLRLVSEAGLADEMERDDRLYREMQRATVAGDLAACKTAARDAGQLMGSGSFQVILCDKLADVARVGRRLEAARR